jgi:hypothetical protein
LDVKGILPSPQNPQPTIFSASIYRHHQYHQSEPIISIHSHLSQSQHIQQQIMEETHLPLAAQKIESNDDPEEEAHFHQVCRSYQQYATFHQTIQQGVNYRMQRLLNNSLSSISGSDGGESGPTVASILPMQLMPGHVECQRQNKEFCDGTIRNQFFLDSVLRYSG